MLFAGQLRDLINLFPWSRIRKQKASLRGVLEQHRRVYDKDKACQDAQVLVRRITELPQFKQAKTIMLYSAVHNEIDIQALLEQFKDQKTFLLPVTHRRGISACPYEGEEKMRRGKHRIAEPTTTPYKGTIDLILVPGVAFDRFGYRLGRGGGYYDKFLRQHPKAFKIGVGYDFQFYKKELPYNLFDTRVNAILTPTKSIGL